MKAFAVIASTLIALASPSVAQTRLEILDAQLYLNGLGYNAGPADGVWGPNTASALVAFAEDEGIDTSQPLRDQHLAVLRERVEAIGVQLPAARLPNGQPYDPLWPPSEWHPDMYFDADYVGGNPAYIGGFSRRGWQASATILPHQFNIVTAPHPVRYGTHSERFEIRPDDYSGMASPQLGNRSEIRQESSRAPEINSDYWVSWSFFYESLPRLDSSYGWHPMFGQWKVDVLGAPIIAFRPSFGGSFVYVGLDDMYKNMPSYEPLQSARGHPCSLFNTQEEAGTWIDIVVNTDFGSTDDGYLNIWINDELRCEYRGQIVPDATVNAGHRTAIHKRGYWSGHLSFPRKWRENHPDVEIPTFVLYYDEWRQGLSREEVDIRLIEARGGPAVD